MDKIDLEDSLISALEKLYGDAKIKILRFEWSYGLIFEATIDTLSETDNGKELDEDGFEEYYACFIMVTKVIQIPKNYESIIEKIFGAYIEVGTGYEISYHNAPNKIFSLTDDLLWENK